MGEVYIVYDSLLMIAQLDQFYNYLIDKNILVLEMEMEMVDVAMETVEMEMETVEMEMETVDVAMVQGKSTDIRHNYYMSHLVKENMSFRRNYI